MKKRVLIECEVEDHQERPDMLFVLIGNCLWPFERQAVEAAIRQDLDPRDDPDETKIIPAVKK